MVTTIGRHLEIRFIEGARPGRPSDEAAEGSYKGQGQGADESFTSRACLDSREIAMSTSNAGDPPPDSLDRGRQSCQFEGQTPGVRRTRRPGGLALSVQTRGHCNFSAWSTILRTDRQSLICLASPHAEPGPRSLGVGRRPSRMRCLDLDMLANGSHRTFPAPRADDSLDAIELDRRGRPRPLLARGFQDHPSMRILIGIRTRDRRDGQRGPVGRRSPEPGQWPSAGEPRPGEIVIADVMA